ncbi:MAG: DUF4262 domain-containing protein [Alphaproteobacteria bacterium]|nr:DUF4262 domain-containing protein [Alphaproteobacteria bacterium]MBU1516295.1 DUF4262 domain-containing protein [Alphaproteobacteria bacterium]MBU2093135.1 DUF4262 domain-containing protein [Alphaproteobacteria bacterium]MBU2151523.1 DUF4262 domain-containing protein [Alphaproteobacteria bacterium]MBU2306493.1 DUF4262 domain-containing protein [Alphaproteobacteria bacterium]
MATALDADPATLDPQETAFVAAIRTYGWFVTHVGAGDGAPGFSYTTGFQLTLGAPEIMIQSLRPDLAHQVLRDIFEDIKAGRSPPIRTPTDQVFANLSACLLPVDKAHYAEHLGWNRWFYAGDDFECLQLVWPDRAGVFPWEPGFTEAMRGDQTDLTARGWPAELLG